MSSSEPESKGPHAGDACNHPPPPKAILARFILGITGLTPVCIVTLVSRLGLAGVACILGDDQPSLLLWEPGVTSHPPTSHPGRKKTDDDDAMRVSATLYGSGREQV